VIEFDQVEKSFGETAVLKGVSMQIAPGEIVSILGASGSGKSTLLRCMNGLAPLSGGQLRIDGLNVSKPRELREIRQRTATVFQHFNLYPHLSMLDNITLAPIDVLRREKAEVEDEAYALLTQVGLADRAKAYPGQLSGGQKQRVGICRALAMKPRYLLLDEVTSALDPEMTAEVLDVLATLAKSGTTMVFVTHEIAFAREISSRIVFLDEGVVRADLPTQDFFAETGGQADERIARFLAKMRNK
jgi:ABC-type polar amino acid transport system ATPase subunit